jgi:hypothetical protein
MPKQVTTRTVTTKVVVQQPRQIFTKKTLKSITGAAILIGIGMAVGHV